MRFSLKLLASLCALFVAALAAAPGATVLSAKGTARAVAPPRANPVMTSIKSRVLLYIYDPVIESLGGKRLHDSYQGFRDPLALTQEKRRDLLTSSVGAVEFQIVDIKVVDDYPWFTDGTKFDDESFRHNWENRIFGKSFDYNRFINDNNIAQRVQSGDIDEVWIYGGPNFGLWESTMAGEGAYWCNSSPVQNAPTNRAFVLMGWNYERGVAEALHAFGHRVESIMHHSYGPPQHNQNNNWSKFTLIDKNAPGLGGAGNVHFPVNGERDYDYSNPRYVRSNADDWYNYPNFQNYTREFNYTEWAPDGADAPRQYMKWWHKHLPRYQGVGPDYFLNNWWRYIADVNQFKGWNGNLRGRTGNPTVQITSPSPSAAVSGVTKVRVNASVYGALDRVELYVDGVLHSSDELAPYVFEWNTAGLAGAHTLEARAYEAQEGRWGVSAPVLVNAGCYSPTSPAAGAGTFDNTSGLLRYCGSWAGYNTYPFAWNSTLHLTKAAGSSVFLRYTGSRITFRYSTASNRGLFKVFHDGGDYGYFDARTPDTRRQVAKTWTLPHGTHTVEVQSLNGGDTNVLDLNAFVVDVPVYPPGTYDDTSPALNYQGTWTRAASPTRTWSNVRESSVTFSFNGDFLTYVFTRAPNRGKAAVTIDGVDKGLVDLYAATTRFGEATVFSGLGPGAHVVNISVSGQRNPSASDQFVDVDQLTAR